MREAELNQVISSDIDLTTLSCSRVTITKEEGGDFRITSKLKFYRCERHGFIDRYLRRKRPGIKWIRGNCSAPTGYYWF